MKLNRRRLKKWTTPRVYQFNKGIILSGNLNDVREGEFIAYTPGTGCTNYNEPCLNQSEFYSAPTGKNNSSVLCYNDARTNTYIIPICS